MNPTTHAIRVGLHRGWTEFLLSLRSPQDQSFNLFTALAVLGYMWINRTDQVAGSDLLAPTFAMPSIIGALVVFGIIVGPAYSLAMEREDGTLLRMKAVPRGMVGYVAGQLLFQSLSVIPGLAVILVPGALLFDDVVPTEPSAWVAMTGFLVLGLLATMPIGLLVGALVPNTQKVFTWGMLPSMGLASISGVFVPIDRLWGWLQAVAQFFPMYWMGLGMRSVFLPDSAVTLEIGDSWRSGQAVAVLAAWAIAGILVTPTVLRRVVRRQSGAAVAAAREAAAQWVH